MVVQALLNGSAESVFAVILNRLHIRYVCAQLLQLHPCVISAAVVYHDDFVRHICQTQFQMKMLHCGCNAAFFVVRGNHHAE